MRISKIYNNNCVATVKDDKEIILTGSGIGFQKKKDDLIDSEKIEKRFLVVDEHRKDFEDLINRIPTDYFETTRTIIEYAEDTLGSKLNDSINVPMTDHIANAIYRFHEGLHLPNLFLNDFKTFYPNEYGVAEWALSYINKKYNVNLPEDELAYLTMHLVNGGSGKGITHAQNTVYFVNEVTRIISEELELDMDKDSLSYQRLITHLKYLSHRILGNEVDDSIMNDDINDDFSLLIVMKLKKFDSCVNKIASFVEKKFKYNLSMDERMYISIHLYQLIHKK